MLSLTIRAGALGALALIVARRTRWRTLSIGRCPRNSRPPVLRKQPHMVPFGAVAGQNRGANPMSPVIYIQDQYFHARDDSRKNEEVLAHLRAENEYTEAKTQHLKGLVDELYKELLSHLQETDTACPYPHGDYLYYTKTEQGKSYKWHCRKKGEEGKEEILLNVNELAEGLKHCEVAAVSPSPCHNCLAYSVDSTGNETYNIYFKNLNTGELLADSIEGVSGSVSWGRNKEEVFYCTFDDAHRRNKVWRHIIGRPRSEDVCLITENDELFRVFFFKSRSGSYLFVGTASSETTEYRFLDLTSGSLEAEPKLTTVEPKRHGVIYSVDHQKKGDIFYIVTNCDKATNFKLMQAPAKTSARSNWKDVCPYDPAIKTNDVACFDDYLVIEGREGGFQQVWVVPIAEDGKAQLSKMHKVCLTDEPISTIAVGVNKVYETANLMLSYSSPTTPSTVYDYHMHSKEKKILKETPCPNYDRSLYACERWEAKADDGTVVPMSVVYRKDKRTPDKPQTLHLYGYGSYEISIDPDFRSSFLPLLDRGVVYVTAHIRGGGEMGRTWYEGAKYLNKKKTFEDFVTCAQYLVDSGKTSPQLMTIEGRSAGGLLMGAVLNMRPDLFTGAIAGVPFVDVMNTMSDASIPLTTGEWEEWGNPNEMKYFPYMLSYSPYENVKAQNYPSILVTSGLHDPRVAYWEPTKWVAKLRELKTDNNEVLLKMDLESGHFSASDRYHYLKEKAFDTAFLLDRLGLVR